jgi:diguanylate cyclase (GGDEF)-like protein
VVGRWGGDEFVALLPGAGPQAAASAVQRLEEAVAQIEMQGHRLGVDIGIATYPEDGVDLLELMRVADARMYDRKARHKEAQRDA